MRMLGATGSTRPRRHAGNVVLGVCALAVCAHLLAVTARAESEQEPEQAPQTVPQAIPGIMLITPPWQPPRPAVQSMPPADQTCPANRQKLDLVG
jgi:hypothetical protein